MRRSFLIAAIAPLAMVPAVAAANPDASPAGTVRHIATYQVDGLT